MSRTSMIALALALVVLGPSLSVCGEQADLLIAVPGTDDSGLEMLLEQGYRVVVHCNDFALVLGDIRIAERLSIGHLGAEPVTERHEGAQYFVIQATVPDAAARCSAGKILYERNGLIVYSGPLEEALAIRAGHACILPVTERTIRAIQPEPIEISLDVGDRDLIQDMVDAVSQPAIESYVSQLSTLDRYTWSQDCRRAGEGIRNALAAWGYADVRQQRYTADWAPNVIAIKTGSVYPDEYVLIGGHYDSFAYPWPGSAPGADDNASGSATVLEAARIMAGYEFERSLVFVTFSGEELGLWGSDALASYAASHGIDIRAVINVDMDGYVEPGMSANLDVIANNPSYWIYELVADAAAIYVPDLEIVYEPEFSAGGSDHQSFWAHGYEAIWFFEDVEFYSPYIHTPSDLVGLSFNDPAFATDCTRVAVAALAILADPIE